MATRSALGQFLSARRASLSPDAVGLPSGSRRRTPGLRREEVATLAGLSVDYYTRLEQGRQSRPSDHILNALGSALRLTPAETAHLFSLAGAAPPPAADANSSTLEAAVTALLAQLRPAPSLWLDRTGTILASNPEGLALFHGIAAWSPDHRNTVRYLFTHPAARTVYQDWDEAADHAVANLREVLTHDPAAPDVHDLAAELSAVPAFLARWSRHRVGARQSAPKTFHHPQAGSRTFHYLATYPAGTQTRITTYLPIESRPHD